MVDQYDAADFSNITAPFDGCQVADNAEEITRRYPPSSAGS